MNKGIWVLVLLVTVLFWSMPLAMAAEEHGGAMEVENIAVEDADADSKKLVKKDAETETDAAAIEHAGDEIKEHAGVEHGGDEIVATLEHAGKEHGGDQVTMKEHAGKEHGGEQITMKEHGGEELEV